ncbi:MAG: glycoside hydrolase family 3 C-terminal domain-containing protein [Deltaproteobacteria bacterium]|jgi:beta-glucosidase|nr:glycoside hydrolase family 3 C-terminal domain-containing protein [Deltaproteobacteria bacterium]
MKILKYLLYALLGIIAVLLIAFLILNHNPKPEIITLSRVETTDAAIQQQAEELVGQMSLEEKVEMMTPLLKSNTRFLAEVIGDGMRYNNVAYYAAGNKRLNLPTMRFFDGPRGLVSGQATCFPVAMQRAASFDRALEERIGEVIGTEIRASGGNYFGGVCINLLRHPAGGRAQESYGEDSYLLGQMGTALMTGVQHHNVMACIKHYAVNNQENTRFEINVEADERVLREVYLPHFKECIDNGAASVMGAYNLFRGDQLCESEYLLTTILKKDWGFKGFTISDFMWGIHHTELAANAGLDIEMPSEQDYGSKLLEAVNDGRVTEEKITESATRVARTILKFETQPDPVSEYPASLIGSDAHIALALEVAEKSMVLMKNENHVLPLDPSKTKNVLVLGERANSENIGDHGSSRVRPAYVVTPMQGFEKRYGSDVNFTYNDGEDMEKARELARSADAVIFVVGYNHDDEGEYVMGKVGGDRIRLTLHYPDVELIQQIAPENDNTIAVLIGGSAIIIEDWKDKVSAIIHAFYPGMEGGNAIARSIFGEVNPGGKLPFTVPSSIDHLPSFDRLATQVTYDRYHGYIKLDHDGNKAAFPFGYGLSYTTFQQDSMRITKNANNIEVSINVTNTGNLAGDEVVQLYVGFDNSNVEREHKLLKGSQRITLQPGETKRVHITCQLDALRWYNPDQKEWQLETMEYQVYIGSSSDESDLIKGSFVVGTI